jgi:hypothetical protein
MPRAQVNPVPRPETRTTTRDQGVLQVAMTT